MTEQDWHSRPATYDQGQAIITSLDLLRREVRTLAEGIAIMSSTLDTDVAALTSAVTAMTTAVSAEVTAIQQLIASGSPSQADLDAITTATTNIQAATAALTASLPAPPLTVSGA